MIDPGLMSLIGQRNTVELFKMADTVCKMVSKLRCLRVLLLSPVALQSCSRNVQGNVGVMPSLLCRKFHLSAPGKRKFIILISSFY